jgi:hypothetical protein
MNLQQTIIQGIKEQLFFNDYLVLPGFGGFVLKSTPSHFSASGGLLIPPSKTVSFNAQLKQNDGILAIWLQNKIGCTAPESIRHLQDFSEFCSGVLNAKRRFSLEGIGFFYLDFENNICFEPQQDSNFLSKSFGLSPVSLKEIEPLTNEIKKENVFVDRKSPEPEKREDGLKRKRNYRRLINPVLLGITLMSLLGLLVTNSKLNGELRSSIIGRNSTGNYVPVAYPDLGLNAAPAKKSAYVADANGIATVDIEDGKTVAVKVFEKALHASAGSLLPPRAKTHSAGHRFEIVLGCFAIPQNARRMVNNLSARHIEAAISGKNAKGMYVVSNGSYSTKEEAVQRLQEMQQSFPHAWIKTGE